MLTPLAYKTGIPVAVLLDEPAGVIEHLLDLLDMEARANEE